MLFLDIKNISIKRSENKFFLEKINIINELIKKYCTNANIDFNNIIPIEEYYFKELNSIGILSNRQDLVLLQKIIPLEYNDLLKTLSFYHKNKKETLFILNNFYNRYRKQQQKKQQKVMKPKVIDLFCGAGGFSLGFVQENYQIELANDIDYTALETYKLNHPGIHSSKVVQGDISYIIKNIDKDIDKDIDIIIGGPPCQSFSSANQQRAIDDPRNILYKYYIKAVEKIKPKFILMENVRGMKKIGGQVVEDFNHIGYDVKYKLFDSSDFSVAQKRIRLLYIGINKEYALLNNLTPDLIISEIEKELINKPRYILKDTLEYIKPLQCANIKNITEIDCEYSGEKIAYNLYQKESNEYINLINHNIIHKFVFNHKARFNNHNDQEIYKRLEEGKNSTCKTISDIMPYANRNHIFKDKYFKLIEKNPSKTITAHMKMDCHSHIHPKQIRGLTPREAARIQSFPDNYIFLGSYLNTYRQIGNAVPPLMSQVFAKIFKKFII
ncbi:DNA cytosine methyltransferase [Sulfurimonas sp.]|uniref:DNA cytosine methyltransferase n=1 Tax=Sulfurimonas sp. TaxID=2022749 RepID=UPI002B489D89|nr:DNA cytosine methyltransferase [Sulfurimonas sp.]